MQAFSTPSQLFPLSRNGEQVDTQLSPTRLHAINPMTLARLDFGLFKSLYGLGTSTERMCAALDITLADFDYIRNLTGASLSTRG